MQTSGLDLMSRDSNSLTGEAAPGNRIPLLERRCATSDI